ncbi:hypothetical protein J2R99_000335 [Rhodopseudomonas julia]|uniref:PhoD-like phosphatase domain-containing protein n=1 Tax=Rhodopseudomonas julia TaxID=200617 RepID=A0ABU0C3H3_9BRAD|nr:alkaline phosphatase D family protein [Rhodopseudomonas julia]MDQ0324486.1 hypothetical protein [Rhodopseudomonas julia]
MNGRVTDMADNAELQRLAGRLKPLLFLRGMEGKRVRLAVLLIRPFMPELPNLVTRNGAVEPELLLSRYGLLALRYTFTLPVGADVQKAAWYELEGTRYVVNTAYDGDLAVAFVSCNGQEEGDRQRPEESRNVLWARLDQAHAQEPLHLLLHGGDQIYADEILETHPLTREWGRERGDPGANAGAEVPEVVATLRRVLLQRYLELYGQPAIADILCRVPSLAMWDDHDICDGWGSLPDKKLDSPVGNAVFAVAREHFLLFQMGAVEGALPETCLDASGTSLTWRVEMPGLTLVAPDLRSERRRDRVMGPAGWRALTTALGEAEGSRILFLSSVPALGPRLSLIEPVMRITPIAEKYEDDLRDQWQSRTHREEWCKFLRTLLAAHERDDTRLTVLSGEIHLATRGTLASDTGELHQLVASGITHPPPPKAYAATLGALASLGSAPLKEHPIKLLPLPGKSAIYTAERNYLMLARRHGAWEVWWELESGPTEKLVI